MDEGITHRLRRIKLLVLDCDGVLTDGLLYLQGGEQPTILTHVRDGLGIRMLHLAGLATAVISGRFNTAIQARAKALGMLDVLHDRLDKGPALEELLAKHGYAREQCAYMGDDLPDLAGFARAGVSLAPADAIEEVRAVADYVTSQLGGRGAVREVAELLLKAQGAWSEVVARIGEAHGAPAAR